MKRNETVELELNRPEVRFLHNVLGEWLDNNLNASDLETQIAQDLMEDLYKAWRDNVADR